MIEPESSIERLEPDAHASAFLESLCAHIDSSITPTDLTEEHPTLNWNGLIAKTWDKLLQMEALEGRLFALETGKTRAYVLTSEPEELGTAISRMKYTEEYLRDNGASERELNPWKKRILYASAIISAIGATAAVGAVAYRRRK